MRTRDYLILATAGVIGSLVTAMADTPNPFGVSSILSTVFQANQGVAVCPPVSVSGNVTPVVKQCTDFQYTLTGNITLKNPVMPAAGAFPMNFWFTQGGSGSYTVTFDTDYEAPGGTSTITLTTTVGALDILSCKANGSVIACGSLLANEEH